MFVRTCLIDTLICTQTALMLAGAAVSVSAHPMLGDYDHAYDTDWEEIIARVHEVEGEACHAHTRSHILMALDENYRNKVEMENLHADEYVARKRKEKFDKLKQKEKLQDMERKGLLKEHHRQLLFSEYDDEIDKTPVVRIPVVFHILYDRDEYNFDVDQLESQIKVLNQDFRANNSAINSGDVNPLWVNRTGDTKVEFYLNATNRRQVRIFKTRKMFGVFFCCCCCVFCMYMTGVHGIETVHCMDCVLGAVNLFCLFFFVSFYFFCILCNTIGGQFD